MSLVLCILDGWGYSENPNNNAIYSAKTPNFDRLWATSPHALLKTHGAAVGLPEYQMGNSEVGHMTIGAGRAIDQDLPKINKAIANGTYADKFASISEGEECHVVGCISDGGVHSHIDHILEACKILRDKEAKVVLHAITDGRDSAPKLAEKFIGMFEVEGFKPATVGGRFYAMDRDNREERTMAAFNSIVHGLGEKFDTWQESVKSQGVVSDEFIVPMSHTDYEGANLDKCHFFIMNFRADRVRQITAKLLETPAKVHTMTEYNEKFTDAEVLFPKIAPTGTIGEIVSNAGLKQLRLAETEKYAHVTYFFNGGREDVFPGEDRMVIPSPQDVKTYDLKPEMSAAKVGQYLVDDISAQKHDFICVNFANVDMVGHTGSFEATVKAVESIDVQLGKLIEACKVHDYDLLVTADHGNAESMWDAENSVPMTSHSKNPVPLIYFGNKDIKLKDGELGDIAEYVFTLLNIN